MKREIIAGIKDLRKGKASILSMAIIISMLFVMVGNVGAEKGSADAFGYYWTDSNSPAPFVSYNWIEISGTGVDSGVIGDDEYGTASIGFTFMFYGNTYSNVFFSTNGYLDFSDDHTDFSNDDIPNTYDPNNYIAPFWGDLRDGGGTIYYQTIGVAPNRQFVLEYYNWHTYWGEGPMTFEAILNETGEIWFQYADLGTADSSSATVGIENEDGTDGCKYSYNTLSIQENLAIMFSLGPMGFGPDQSQQGDPGDEVSYTLTVSNNQAFTDSFDLTSTSIYGWPVNFYDSTGIIPLIDTNGDPGGYPDTGNIPSESTLNIVAKVNIPITATGGGDIATLTATSFNDNTINDTTTLITYIAAALFEPPHDDYGLDTDGDTFYNYLIVNVFINVTLAGDYVIFSDLYDSLSNNIDSDFNFTSLDAGIQIVESRFDGLDIYNNGVDGPYTVELALYDSSFILVDTDTHTTISYTYDEFEPPPALFSPPHSDYGQDTDSDGLFNYLVMDVNIEVSDADTYLIYGDLYDQSGNNWITGIINVESLGAGIQMVQLSFDGEDIYEEGIDGPYLVELDLRDSSWNLIDEDIHTTAAYAYIEFQDGIPPATITDLAVESVTINSVTLNWTAPGDDGYEGAASEYDIRYSTAGPINTETKFNAAMEVTGEPIPQPAGSTEIYEVTGLESDRQYWFAIKAADDVPNWSYIGNSPSGTTLENLAPQILDVKVNDNSSVVVSAGTTVTLIATIDDSATGNSSIGGANYTIGAQQWPGTDMNPFDGSFESSTELASISIDTTGWSEETYDLYVYGWDEISNRNSSSTAYATIIIDSTPPSIMLNSPDNNSIIKAGYLINFSISDQYLNKCFCSIDGGSEQELSEPYEINSSTWDDGSHTVLLKVGDLAANFKLRWFNFTIDSTPPEIILNSPENNTIISEDLEINLTISDVNLYKVTYSKNGGAAKTFSPPYNLNMSQWSDGEYTISIYADDKAGNFNERWFVFTKDVISPEIILTSPENDSLLLEASTIDFDISDDNLNSVSYSTNQGSFKTFESPYDIYTTEWEDGEYIITIKVDDTAGNTNERWYIFRIDTIPPSIISTFPDDEAMKIPVESEVIISFSEPMDTEHVESAISIIPYIEYSLLWSDSNTTLTINFSEPLAYDTFYTVTISTKAEDMAGRELESRYEFEFTTEEKKEEEEGFPILNLLLPLLLAIIVVVIIVALVTAKKRAAAREMIPAQPQIEGPEAIQVTCSICGNLLKVEDIGTTMNVTCPFCASLLTVESRKAAAQMPFPQPYAHTIQISCPQCSYVFPFTDTGGPSRVQCPNCGITGRVDLGGALPGPIYTPPLSKAAAKPSQHIKCPACENVFVVETTARPISIQCPHCGVSGTLR